MHYQSVVLPLITGKPQGCHSDQQGGQQAGQGAVRHLVEDHSRTRPMPLSFIPSHVGIAGYEVAVAAGKCAAENPFTGQFSLSGRDFYQTIVSF